MRGAAEKRGADDRSPSKNAGRTEACGREPNCLTHKDKGVMILGFSSVRSNLYVRVWAFPWGANQ
ncbi:hypothetical protein PT2222_40119 [Paraburkholderia tropica]